MAGRADSQQHRPVRLQRPRRGVDKPERRLRDSRGTRAGPGREAAGPGLRARDTARPPRRRRAARVRARPQPDDADERLRPGQAASRDGQHRRLRVGGLRVRHAGCRQLVRRARAERRQPRGRERRVQRVPGQVRAEEDDRRLLHARQGVRRGSRLGCVRVRARPLDIRAPVLPGRRLRERGVPRRVHGGGQPAVLAHGQDHTVLHGARHPVLRVRADADAFQRPQFRRVLHRCRLRHHVRERREGEHELHHEPGHREHGADRADIERRGHGGRQGEPRGDREARQPEVQVPAVRHNGGHVRGLEQLRRGVSRAEGPRGTDRRA